MPLNLPLMDNNITDEDLDVLIDFLKARPRLTQSENVKLLEEEWAEWLGVKYSIFVNSGSSANMMTLGALKHLYGIGEVIVPTLTWVSDIVSTISNGFKPVFVDIDPKNLCMAENEILKKITPETKAVFMTYVQGFNGLSDNLLNELKSRNIPLLEDVCESHGATFKDKKLGSYGLASNFSFYFAHHMSTIEGGMVCTDDEEFYQVLRMLRSHGMVREATDEKLRDKYSSDNPELNPDFIFALPACNYRNSEIGAVIGRNQLKRLDANNQKRQENFQLFLDNLDSDIYRTDFDLEGSCNYAFNLVLNKADAELSNKLEKVMDEEKIEFRRGSAGGGNQMRQPYLKDIVKKDDWKNYPEVEHIHFYGYYIGNFPSLQKDKILQLCKILNSIKE